MATRSKAKSKKKKKSRRGRLFPRRKVCRLCENKIERPNYKDVKLLRNFITERGKIIPRRISGACAYHQRRITEAIKRARNIALLPFTEA